MSHVAVVVACLFVWLLCAESGIFRDQEFRNSVGASTGALVAFVRLAHDLSC